MQLANPALNNPLMFARLGKLYVETFLGMALLVVLTTLTSGYESHLVFIAFDTAAIGCLLLRVADEAMASRAVAVAATAPAVEYVSPVEASLLAELGLLMHAAQDKPSQVALMLVSVVGLDGDDAPELGEIKHLVRDVLHRNRDSGIYELEEGAMATAASQTNPVHHFYNLSIALQHQMAARWKSPETPVPGRVTIGVAVADRPGAAAVRLLEQAKHALDRAETEGRWLYFTNVFGGGAKKTN